MNQITTLNYCIGELDNYAKIYNRVQNYNDLSIKLIAVSIDIQPVISFFKSCLLTKLTVYKWNIVLTESQNLVWLPGPGIYVLKTRSLHIDFCSLPVGAELNVLSDSAMFLI